MEKIKALVFDLDGTLVDTLEDLRDSLNFALGKNGLKTLGLEEIKEMVGRGMQNLVEASLGAYKDMYEDVYKIFLEHYKQNLTRKSRPYSGILPVLQGFQGKIPLGVLSNKAHPMVQIIIEKLFPNIPFFDVQGKRPGVPHKPDPFSLLSMAEKIAVEPGHLGFLGDSDVDMITALAAGAIPIGVSWGFRSTAVLEKSGAWKIYHKAEELIDLENYFYNLNA